MPDERCYNVVQIVLWASIPPTVGPLVSHDAHRFSSRLPDCRRTQCDRQMDFLSTLVGVPDRYSLERRRNRFGAPRGERP